MSKFIDILFELFLIVGAVCIILLSCLSVVAAYSDVSCNCCLESEVSK